MEGRNIFVLPMMVKGFMMVHRDNSTSVEMTGVLPFIISWLSLKYNFSYIYLEEIENHMGDTPREKGAISILEASKADLAMGAVYPTSYAYRKVDFTTSWLHSPLSILIPSPEKINNKISSIAAPFQFEVWIMIGVSVLMTLIGLFYVNRYATIISETSFDQRNRFNRFGMVYNYMIAILLLQGSVCYNRWLPVRLVAAVWCLGCLILGAAYSSTLISYITAPPTSQPIIGSLEDILKVNGLKVTVIHGHELESNMLNSKEGIYKHFGDMLRDNPNLRCNKPIECVKMVLRGDHVFINGAPVIESIVYEDHMESGTCRLSIAKKSFMMAPIVNAVQKSSPYLESINRGFLQLWENGLINYWINIYFPKTEVCLSEQGTRQKRAPRRLQRLNLGHLSGAFIILFIGFTVSFVVFIGENVVFYFNARKDERDMEEKKKAVVIGAIIQLASDVVVKPVVTLNSYNGVQQDQKST